MTFQFNSLHLRPTPKANHSNIILLKASPLRLQRDAS